MASKGAKFLILLSRSGATNSPALELLSELRAQGVTVEAPPCDISNLEALSTAIDNCKPTMPPIRGCVQGSMAIEVSVSVVLERQ